MVGYAIRRLLVAIPLLIASTFIVFCFVALSGDPLADIKARNPAPPAATIAALQHELWLDQPLLDRYWHWISGIVTGQGWGPSRQRLDMPRDLFHAFSVTLRLVLAAVLIALVLAVITGVVSAVRQYTPADYTFTFLGFLFLATPTFWFAILLKQVAVDVNDQVGRDIFFTIGDASIPAPAGGWSQLADAFGHLVLPTISLSLLVFASWSRFVRGSMLDVLNSDYVRLARAKGLPRRNVLVRHALRTALIPLTTVTALDIAAILSGAVVTETVYQWRGMGVFLLDSIRARDPFPVTSWLLLAATFVILFNLAADLLYGLLDPRIRYD